MCSLSEAVVCSANDLQFKLPCHVLFCGATMCYKTRLCMSIISNPNLFTVRPSRVILFYKVMQSIYLETQSKLESLGIEMTLRKGIDDLNVESIDQIAEQSILVIDDFFEESSKSKAISDLTLVSRHLNCSVWLIWQSLYSNHPASRIITQNIQIFFLMASPRLLSQIKIFGTQLGIRDKLVRAYQQCMDEDTGKYKYLMLDLTPGTKAALKMRSSIDSMVQYCFI